MFVSAMQSVLNFKLREVFVGMGMYVCVHMLLHTYTGINQAPLNELEEESTIKTSKAFQEWDTMNI